MHITPIFPNYCILLLYHYEHILIINISTKISSFVVPKYNMQKGKVVTHTSILSCGFHANFQRIFSRLIL